MKNDIVKHFPLHLLTTGSHDQPWVSPSGRKRSKPSRVPSFYGEDLKLRYAYIHIAIIVNGQVKK